MPTLVPIFPGNLDLPIIQGGSHDFLIQWNTDKDTVKDISSYTAKLQIRLTKALSTKLLDISTDGSGDDDVTTTKLVIGTGTDGRIQVLIDATVSAALSFNEAFWDIKLSKSGQPTVRLLEGHAYLNKQVTR